MLLLMVICMAVPHMLAVPLAAATADGRASGEIFLICGDAGRQNEPEVSGDTVVWRDGRNGTCYDDSDDSDGAWDIYGVNADTLALDAFVTADNVQNHPELGGDYMVWVDRRSAPVSDPSNSDYNEVYLQNIVTGAEKRLTDDEEEQCRPNTDGKTVVWSQYLDEEDYYAVCAYDIATGKRSEIVTGTTDFGRPQVEGGYVTWKNGTGSYAPLRMTTIASKETTAITTGYSGGPSFDGQSIVWYDNNPNPNELWRYDLGTKTKSVVATSTFNYYSTDHDGEWVAYQMNQGTTDYDLYAYNMLTGVETRVSDLPGCDGNPSVDNGLVAWNNNPTGSSSTGEPDIWGKYLHWNDGLENPLSGVNRFATAALASREAYPYGSDDVVIATAYNWPDALAGGVLAAVLDCPVLLTAPGGLPIETALELDRLGVKNAYVIGGAGVISSAAFEQVSAHVSGKTTRIGGANRFQTSEMVAVKVKLLQGCEYSGQAFFATSANFPDALAGAPVAGALGAPILLADGSTLRDSTVACMKSIGVKKGVVLGATSAVPATVKTRIESVTATSAVRLGAANRYGTSVEIAKYGIANGMSWTSPGLATGANFPDALAAGPMQARYGSPLLLTNGSTLSAESGAALKANKAFIERVSFVGGVKVITNTVRNQVKALLQ